MMIFTVCVCFTRCCSEYVDGSYQPANADKELNVYLKVFSLHVRSHAHGNARAEKRNKNVGQRKTGCSVSDCDPKQSVSPRRAQKRPNDITPTVRRNKLKTS